MSTTRRILSKADENAEATGCKRDEVKKCVNAVARVPRKALGSVGMNSKKQDNNFGVNSRKRKKTVAFLAQLSKHSRSRSKRGTIYHDSDDERKGNCEDGESQGQVSKKLKAGQSLLLHASTTEPDPGKISSDTASLIQGSALHKNLDTFKSDISMCFEYTDEIFAHLFELEKTTTCEVNYVCVKQSPHYIRPSMRAILVDWLIEVHLKFQLLPEVLYLGINIMDRYLSKNDVSLSRLQLVAITSLLIAAKFEEVNLPKLLNYVYITDNAYSTEEIKTAECLILNSLDFNIGWPNPMNFLRRISKVDDYNHQTRNYAKIFLEYAMCCPRFVDTLPSILALISMRCAMELNYGADNMNWDENFEWYSSLATNSSKYNFHSLCDELVNEISEPSTQLKALAYKYNKMGVWDKVKTWSSMRVVRK